ncbi:MAG: ribosome assembly cofactor RimP [Candidatus Zophobacter franzmannii]|nr:ribosome assembly cofactor RimP [Candidatus Zophobacter franzmannii]
MRKDYLQTVEEYAKKASLDQGVSLYDVEEKMTSKGIVLLISINRIGGVTVDDCTNVSKAVELSLEESELISSPFMLEVSSPGVERELKFKKHYASAINVLIKVEYDTAEDRKTVIGILSEVTPKMIKIDGEEGQTLITFESIHKARTYFDFKTKGSGK